MLPFLDRASAAIDRAEDPTLRIGVVTGRVNALCELGRAEEARRVLQNHIELYEARDDRLFDGVFRGLEGRIALRLGETDAAEAAFAACQECYLALGREYDAALVALDRVENFLKAAEWAKLRRLVAQIVPEFQDRGVAIEALKALDMLVRTLPLGAGVEGR